MPSSPMPSLRRFLLEDATTAAAINGIPQYFVYFGGVA